MTLAVALRRAGRPVDVPQLNLDTVYLSPSGRPCKLLPSPARGPGSGGASFTFRYINGPRRRDGELVLDEFTLARNAVYLLRVLG
jgi:hypothetical protein